MDDPRKIILTLSEVQALNVYAVNRTRLHYVGGIDFDLWQHFPGRDGHLSEVTDGHDHGPVQDADIAPFEGWEVVADTKILTVEQAVALLRGLRGLAQDVPKIAEAQTKGVRQNLSWQARSQALQLAEHLGAR